MSSLGRNGLLGFGFGVTLSSGLIAFLIIKEMMRRRSERRLVLSRSCEGFAVDGGLNLGGEKAGCWVETGSYSTTTLLMLLCVRVCTCVHVCNRGAGVCAELVIPGAAR